MAHDYDAQYRERFLKSAMRDATRLHRLAGELDRYALAIIRDDPDNGEAPRVDRARVTTILARLSEAQESARALDVAVRALDGATLPEHYRLVRDTLAAGAVWTVLDPCGAPEVEHSADPEAILDELDACDQAEAFIGWPDGTEEWVQVVHNGTDLDTTICDYSPAIGGRVDAWMESPCAARETWGVTLYGTPR